MRSGLPSKKIFAVISLALLAVPFVAFAYTAPNIWPTGFWGPLLSCTGNYSTDTVQQTTIGNLPPCQSLCDLVGTIINIIYFVMTLALFIFAPAGFIIGAIMIMMAGAKPEMLSSGKKAMTGAVIGVAIVLCAYLLVATFVGALNLAGVGGFSTDASTCQSG